MGVWNGKVAWVTGGGTGIGKAVSLELARQGARVAVSGRRQERLDEAVAEIEALGGQALAVVCDVTSEADCEAAVATILAAYGQLDLCFANAGFAVAGKIARLTDADWRRQFEVNVFGLLNTVRAALPALTDSKGRVGLVGSVAGFVYAPRNGAYNASKAAVRAIGATLSAELHGKGVTCTTIHPGFIESEIGQVDNEGVFHPERTDGRPQQVMWTADAAAKAMVKGLASRRSEVIVTGHGKVLAQLSRWAPGLTQMLAARFA